MKSHVRAAFAALLIASFLPAGTPLAAPAPAPAPAAARPTVAPARPATVAAADDRLDAVAAMVNDDVVLQSDVEEQLYGFLMRSGARPDSAQMDTLRRQILDKLIDDKLIIAEAKRQKITVADAEVAKQVEQAVADAKERMGGEAAFREQLQRENLTEARLREKYKTDIAQLMMAERLKKKLYTPKPVLLPEAEAYFAAHKDQFPKVPPQVQLSVIQIPSTPESSAVLAGKMKIDALRKRIVGGEKFAKVAAEASEDPGSARSGGDLGFFMPGTMEPAVESAAFSLKLGQLSAPLRSTYGWHLVEALERDTVKTIAGKDSLGRDGKPVLEAHARHILVLVRPTEADGQRARDLAIRVRDEARKGTNFGTLARRYSKYDGPADADGNVGFVSLGSLQPNIRAGLDTLEVGEVSDVLVNQAGFNIFKVTDRKPEREYAIDEIRDELPQAVQEAQFRDWYDGWVKGLRSKAQIDIRNL